MRSEVRILSGATFMMILEIFSSGPLETNTILVGCPVTRDAALFDAPLGSAPLFAEALHRHHLTPKMLLLTHSHWDHIADAAALKNQFGIPLFVHAEDAPNVENPGTDRLPVMFPIEGVKPDGFLTDHQELTLGTLHFQVIHTPGHTPGGVCFWFPHEKVLISGDTLFRGSIGNLSLPTSRPALMGASLKKLARLPGETRVIPGHGRETTIAAESWIAHVVVK